MSTEPDDVFFQARLSYSIRGTFGAAGVTSNVPDLYRMLRHDTKAVRARALAVLHQITGLDEIFATLAYLVDDPGAKLTHEAKLSFRNMCVPGYGTYSKHFEPFKKEFLIEKPNEFRSKHREAHSTLLRMIDPEANGSRDKFCQMLLTFSSFVRYGSFRQVAMDAERRCGVSRDLPDHTGPMYQVHRLAEILGIALTRPSEGNGRRRTELTEAGTRLGEWIELHPYLID